MMSAVYLYVSTWLLLTALYAMVYYGMRRLVPRAPACHAEDSPPPLPPQQQAWQVVAHPTGDLSLARCS